MSEATLLNMFSCPNEFISFCAVTCCIQQLFFQGGEADVNTVGKMILNDFQRGKLPYFVAPPSKVKRSCKILNKVVSLICRLEREDGLIVNTHST